ncbi:eukaryotic translation initiation factor-like isoform X2 [Lycium barbarum]|uniref:eukaryotic translation initiation factor-like isoform X2 n=1 Tax=Lycium barbarum TaxID=112863 RepID=UPI00293F3220|nr:eukaryotic translation initiation factor-like isoform X2 [Lycium barbarum]
MLLMNKLFCNLFRLAVKFLILIPPYSFVSRLLHFIFNYLFDDQISLLGRVVKYVVNISDHILKIKQEFEAQLFSEDANRGRADTNTTGDTRIEGRKRARYTRDQLLQLRDNIIKLKQEVEAELFGEDSNRDHIDTNVQSQTSYSEPQFARTPISRNQEGGPARKLIKAKLPCAVARRSNLSDKDCILKTVQGILNQPTLKKFDLLKGQLIDSGITSADTLVGVVSLIFDQALLDATFCPMYAQLCSDLTKKLPPIPSDKPGGKEITFRRVLLNKCQETFELREEVRKMTAPEQESERKAKEELIKLITLGIVRFLGELFKQKIITRGILHRIIQDLLPYHPKGCPAEENVEAICQLFNNIGKLLHENQESRIILDGCFNLLQKLSTNPQLSPRLRLLVCDVVDLRANNWVPKPILIV